MIPYEQAAGDGEEKELSFKQNYAQRRAAIKCKQGVKEEEKGGHGDTRTNTLEKTNINEMQWCHINTLGGNEWTREEMLSALRAV